MTSIEPGAVSDFSFQPLTLSLSLNGQLDTVTAPQLETAIQERIGADTQIIIFNLENLDFVSSAGLRIFAKTRKNMKGKGGKVFFTNLTPQVKKVFDIVKAVPLSEVFTDTDELDVYLTKIQANVKDHP